jgi:hypothetical protein
MADKPEELVHVPQDLTLVSDGELETYGNTAVAEFDRINGLDDVTADTIQYGLRLADDIDRVRAEVAARNARAAQTAESNRAKLLKDQANLKARVHGVDGDATGTGPSIGDKAAPVDVEAIAAAAAQGATAALVNVLGDRVAGRALTQVVERPTLADARRFAPQGADVAPAKLSVTASVDIPGVARGEGVDNLERMVDIFQRKAKSMPVTQGQPNYQLVASIRNEYEHTVDDRTSPGQIEELFRHLTSSDKKDALVAAGGWCAPSEIRYDFFNIACEDGLIDLPTFGVSRGGIQFPVSPSLADVIGTAPNQAFGGFSVDFTGDSIPWLWTEADDIAAVTGDPTKPCIRVPCPDFDEERLECYGLCVTAGNLTDDAYPEATRNFLQLMNAAHAHAMNARTIALMVARSSAAIDTGGFAVTGNPVYQQVYGGLSLAATDYRARYGMCMNDVLEVVAPFWVREVIRADIAWRTGVEARQIPNSEIDSHFAALNVRIQWVNDWQVRGAGQFGNATAMTEWPTSATFMVYAAGTFIRGNGLQLDLGVVRDSTLNETNDHTAAWSEECHLIARVGHESRQYTINFCVNGRTGAADGTCLFGENL